MKNIYLEPEEEIIAIIDRLAQESDHQVNLVIPGGAQIWQSLINLKLLKREADSLGKDVTLIVSDRGKAEAGEKIGFKTRQERDFAVEFVSAAPVAEPKVDMIDYLVQEMNAGGKETEAELAAIFNQKKSDTPKMADIVSPLPKSQKSFLRRLVRPKTAAKTPPPEPCKKIVLNEPIFSEERKYGFFAWKKVFVVFLSLALVAAVVVAYLALPTTELVITPKKERASFDLTVAASKGISQIDQSLNQIPLQEIKVEKTKSAEFVATEEKEVTEKAHGMIKIFNEFSSSPQILVATTRFETPDGKIFRITENITVPGAVIADGKIVASSIEVAAVADQPGEDYNIGPANFTIPGFRGTPKFASFYGRSGEAMSGGKIGKVKVISSQDLARAKEQLTGDLKDELRAELDRQIPADLKLVTNGVREEITSASEGQQVGDQIDKFVLEMEGTISALLYKESDLKELVNLNLLASVAGSKTLVPETQEIVMEEPVVDWSAKEASFTLAVAEEIAWQINEEELKGYLAGQTETEVRTYLANRPEIEKTKVSFWPFWVKRVPLQKERIKIILDLTN